MDRDAFISLWIDEMTGLLLNAWQRGEVHGDAELAKAGRFFVSQQRRARSLLGRMWDSMQKQQPVANGLQQRQQNPESVKTGAPSGTGAPGTAPPKAHRANPV